MNDEVLIVDSSHDHKWFTAIPNIIDDMDLSSYGVRLYLRLKRRAGENGRCWENTRNLAKGCKMSLSQVTKVKRELQDAGLIEISEVPGKHGHYPSHSITILDIWPANYKKYIGSPETPPVRTANRWPVRQESASCSPGTIKEEPYEEEAQNKEKGTSSVPPSPSGKPPEGTNGPAIVSLISHPTIQAWKEATGYYPPKDLYQHIIEKIGDNPNKALMWRIHQFMLLKGNSPRNVSHFLDRYETNLQYIHSDDRARLDAMQNPFEVVADVSEDDFCYEFQSRLGELAA
jgi:hypothetical protein